MKSLWTLEELGQPPQTFDAPGWEEDGVRALFFEGSPFHGKPTRVFAYLGFPEKTDSPAPAMVLIHGGGGTASADWVRLWTRRGYAAIAFDTCGALPGGAREARPRHEHSGPAGWGGWDQTGEAPQDQWVFHAVASAVLAHSLLRSFPHVDASRIGLTGISWGGFLTCLLVGIDTRFAFAAPVYGCAFVRENEFLNTLLPAHGAAARWLELWEPAPYLSRATMPILWVNGTNDFAFPLDVYSRSHRLPQGEKTLCVQIGMAHSQVAGSQSPEIAAFADAHLKGRTPLPGILPGVLQSGAEGGETWANFTSESRVVGAQLCFAGDAEKWTERAWRFQPARLENDIVQSNLPDDASAWFFNLTDERGLVVSSDMVVR